MNFQWIEREPGMSELKIGMPEILAAEQRILPHVPAPALIRSWRLERELGLAEDRRVWLVDYGWTPSGSFKLFGACNWLAAHLPGLEGRPVAAHSSGNFASGIAYAGMRLDTRVIVVMPETAPRVKFELTQSLGAEVRTYDIATDHLTGQRDKLTREIAEEENAVQASPYDDPDVIAGNGVGALWMVRQLQQWNRQLTHFLCPVSGGGLMAGQALAVHDGFPDARIIGVEPSGADDFRRSLAAGERVRLERPESICDGLLSYDVGEWNWPILQQLVAESVTIDDEDTQRTMAKLYQQHGLRTEPSGAIAAAVLSCQSVDLSGSGDIAVVVSGRNVDETAFREWIQAGP